MTNDFHWAVVVGINEYPGGFATLQGAQRDAKAFHDWLVDPEGGGLPPEEGKGNVKLITHTLPKAATLDDAKPTRDEIFRAIQRAFQAAKKAAVDVETWQKTRLYLYFSGHGVAADAMDASLLAADADSLAIGINVSCRELLDFFTVQPYFAEVVIFADCCRDDVLRKVDPSPVPWKKDQQVGNGEPKIMRLFASKNGVKAFEEQTGSDPRGHFSRCLFHVLNSRINGKDVITSSEIIDQVTSLMTSVLEQRGFKNPSTPSPLNGFDITFGVTSKKLLYPVEINAPPGTTHLRVLDNANVEVAKADVVDVTQPVVFQLPVALYQVECLRGVSSPELLDLFVVPGHNPVKPATVS